MGNSAKKCYYSSHGRTFIDQTQSMNIFMEDSHFNKMTSCHIMSWKLGLKTGIYYFHTKPKSDAIKFTINEESV